MTSKNKKKEDPQNDSVLKCFHCNAVKYCPDCLRGYGQEDGFCSKCSKPLSTLKAFENKDCPVCSKEKGLVSSIRVLRTQIVNIDYSKELEESHLRRRGGVIIPKVCNCGEYRPTSTQGVINDTCANCGGEKRQVL